MDEIIADTCEFVPHFEFPDAFSHLMAHFLRSLLDQ